MFARPPRMRWKLRRTLVLASVLAGVGLSSVPALAQSGDEEARLRKIESEVRALQRRVFPGGDGRFFEPEVDTGTPGTEIVPVGPSTSAVTDILGRLDSIEAQLARLTSQVEVNAYDIGLLTSRLEVIEAEREQRLAAERAVEEAAQREAAERQAALEAEPEPPSPERVAAVQAIAKPASGDPGDDEYVYGFRLWEGGFFPEAQQQLRLFLDRYPDHSRVSYGRNLLGRAYLDDGKPREAAPWFLQNYQSDPDGIRAPDSLLFLSEAMVAIEDTNRACIALAEFGEKFPELASGRLMEQYERNRARVTCD